GPAGGPLGHRRAVDAEPVGQDLLRPAGPHELPVDPLADRPAADLRGPLLEAARDRVGKRLVVVELELAEELACQLRIGRVAGGPTPRAGPRGPPILADGEPHRRLPL